MKKEIKDENRRVQCNWCNSVFYEDYIVEEENEEEACPVCKEKGYIMDIQPKEDKPRWETPEQWEQRTGEKWPDNAPVFHCYIDGGGFLVRLWEVGFYRNYRTKNKPLGLCVVCATEAGPPPDGWRPEE